MIRFNKNCNDNDNCSSNYSSSNSSNNSVVAEGNGIEPLFQAGKTDQSSPAPDPLSTLHRHFL